MGKERSRNLRKIYRAIWKYGPLERKEIQEHTNLSWGAVSQYCNSLLDSGLVVQASNPQGSVGKIPTALQIATEDYFLIGVDLSANTIRCSLLDFCGCIRVTKVATILSEDHILSLLTSTLAELIESFPGKKILAIGVSAAGNIDTEQGILLQLVLAPSWKDLHIKEELEAAFSIPVFLLRDPDSVMMAEKYCGAVLSGHYQNILSINLNYGIGMSAMIHSKLYSSPGKVNGEIGHIQVVKDGTLCNCGHRGCLEMYASKLGIVRQFMEAVNRGECSSEFISGSFDANYQHIIELAMSGDKTCRELFLHAGELLGHVFASFSTVMEPEVILLYGDLIASSQLWASSMMETFSQERYPGCSTRLLFSTLDTTAPILGVAFHAFDIIMDRFLAEQVHI